MSLPNGISFSPTSLARCTSATDDIQTNQTIHFKTNPRDRTQKPLLTKTYLPREQTLFSYSHAVQTFLLGKSCVPSSSVHIRCRAAAGRPESLTLTLTLTLALTLALTLTLTLTLTLSLTLNLLNLTLSLKLTSVLTHRPSYAKWRHSSRDHSAA